MKTYRVVKYFDTYPEKYISLNLPKEEAEQKAQKLNDCNHSPNIEYLVREENN